MNIYDFKAVTNEGKEIGLDAYRGKVLLIVNTATKCGLTPQYEALQALYSKYKEQGLVVLDFPSNQFLEQAPGSDEEIESFCTLTYNTDFPRFQKTDVNGENASELFKWLKKEQPEDFGDAETAVFAQAVSQYTPGQQPGDIKWNFGKFLIDREGGVFRRYAPAYSPEKLEQDITNLLG